MNDRVRLVLIVTLVLVVISCIYVPWVFDYPMSRIGTARVSAGYGLIFSQPNGLAYIDYKRVILQVIGIVAGGGIAALGMWRKG